MPIVRSGVKKNKIKSQGSRVKTRMRQQTKDELDLLKNCEVSM